MRLINKKAAIFTACAFGLMAGMAHSASAVILFATSYDPVNPAQKGIYRVDTSNPGAGVTPVLVPVPPPGTGPDSIVFLDPNNLIYSNFDAGEIHQYNLATNTDTLIKGGLTTAGPRDMLLDTATNSLLVSLNNTANPSAGSIVRISLAPAHTLTTLRANVNADGLVFDKNNNLYAAINKSFVVRLDQTTGATLLSSPDLGAGHDLDGLTYNPATDLLYVGDAQANGGSTPTPLYNIAASTLGSFNALAFQQFLTPDGIVFDNSVAGGQIFVASRFDPGGAKNFRVYSYNINGNSSVALNIVQGLDDLAPVIGPGSPGPTPSVPLPAAVWGGALLGAIMIGSRVYRSRRENAIA